MSIVINFAPGVEITLFSRSLMVRNPAVGVPQSKGQLVWSPLMHRHVLSFSFFFFLVPIITDDARIGHIFSPVPRDIRLPYKEHGISTVLLVYSTRHSLLESTYFITKIFPPNLFVLRVFHQVPVLHEFAGVTVENSCRHLVEHFLGELP